jgi:hypothetical protein
MIPGTQSIAHLFVIHHEAGQQHKQADLQKAVMESQHRMRQHPSAEEVAHIKAAWIQTLQASDTTTKQTFAASLGGVSLVSFHPSLHRRFARLRTLGATVAEWQPKRFWQQWGPDAWGHLWTLGPAKGALLICLLLLLVILMPIAVGGLFLVVVMLAMVNLLFMEFLIFAIHGVFIVLTFLKTWALS